MEILEEIEHTKQSIIITLPSSEKWDEFQGT